MNYFQHLKQQFKNLLPCQLCGLDRQHQYTVCKDCWQGLPWQQQTIRRHQHPILVACEYQFPINRIIQKFKYEQQLHFQTLLAGCLLQIDSPEVDALVPMPDRKSVV